MAGEKGKNSKKGEASALVSLPDGSGDDFPRQRPLHGRTTGPTRRSTKGQWTAEEDAILCRAVQQYKGKNWKKIAECFADRTDVQCLHRWQKVLNPELVKGPWSKEEDEKIIEMVNKYGAKKWSTIAQALPGRIGKQCRERWHNHLNPAINRDAWTQDEEIVLIRAHQIYGNKWAELTKFLPGRTDNAIKNHWNSSVKKKLDTYLASGLVAQFQGLPHVENLPNPVSSTAMNQQNSEESNLREGAEVEVSSDHTQNSGLLGCSQSDCEVNNTALLCEGLRLGEEVSQREIQNFQLPEYYSSIEDFACVIPQTQSGSIIPTNALEHNTLHGIVQSVCDGNQINSEQLSNDSSKEIVQNIPDVMTAQGCHADCTGGHQGSRSRLLFDSTDCSVDKFIETVLHHDFAIEVPFTTSEAQVTGPADCQSSIYYGEASSTLGPCSHPSFPISPSGMLGASYCHSLMTVIPPLYISPSEGNLKYRNDNLEIRDIPVRNQESGMNGCLYDVSISSPPGGSKDSLHVERGRDNNTPEPNNVMSVDSMIPFVSSDGTPNARKEELPDSEALFYEPPRFPSIDIPFVSCDLISSGDLQQAYSPLGIRQLMMSSMSCSPPYNLWDSPSQDDSPDAVLKSAAKSFICTPSIMKKRQRELLSPLPERRNDKKSGTDMNRGPFYSSSTSRDNGARAVEDIGLSGHQEIRSESFTEGKGNLDGRSNDQIISLGTKSSGKKSNIRNSDDKMEECESATIATAKADSDSTTGEACGVLVEHDVNDSSLLSAPRNGHPTGIQTDCAESCEKRNSKAMDTTGNRAAACGSLSTSSAMVLPRVEECEEEAHSTQVQTKCCAHSLEPQPVSVEKCASSTNFDLENLNIFADTPGIKRGLESPSAWKSPWFMSSLLTGQRIDADITFEDINYFMSPGDRSYDAIGLMRQLSEHTAAALAEAHEVLGKENLKEDASKGKSQMKGIENHLPQPQNAKTEGRVLDFSGCSTPGKRDNSKASSAGKALSLSSPSSYLLKSCR